jgi:TPP-dependent pyruvate/acetoin dehydrogenase alpha subunit
MADIDARAARVIAAAFEQAEAAAYPALSEVLTDVYVSYP